MTLCQKLSLRRHTFCAVTELEKSGLLGTGYGEKKRAEPGLRQRGMKVLEIAVIYFKALFQYLFIVQVKVNQSHYRPGQTLRVPGG
jgi:hypothetical protein